MYHYFLREFVFCIYIRLTSHKIHLMDLSSFGLLSQFLQDRCLLHPRHTVRIARYTLAEEARGYLFITTHTPRALFLTRINNILLVYFLYFAKHEHGIYESLLHKNILLKIFYLKKKL